MDQCIIKRGTRGVLVPINDGLRPVAVHKDVRTQNQQSSPQVLDGGDYPRKDEKEGPLPRRREVGAYSDGTSQHDCREAHNKRGRSLRGAAVKQVAKENAQSDGTATTDGADCSPLPLAYGRCFEGIVPHHPQLDQDLNATRSSNNGRVRRLLGGRRWECSGG